MEEIDEQNKTAYVSENKTESAEPPIAPVTSADVEPCADNCRADGGAAASMEEADGSGDGKKAARKHGKLVNFFKVFGFFILILAVNAAMYFGGRPNIPGALHTYRTYQLNRIFSERKNSIDVLYVGHSGVHCGVSSMEIYDEYGIAGYSCSQPLLLPWESYDIVVDVLKEQSLKMIALEVNAFFYDKTGDFFNSFAKRATLDIFPFYESHLYWRDGFGKSERDPYKNFPFFRTTVPYNGEVDRDHPKEGVYHMNAMHKKYLNKFVELCNSRGIELVLFELPVITYWSWERHNCIVEFAKEKGLRFFDMNVGEVAKTVNIDWKRDFTDAGDHLNFYGAIKSSHVLGEWLRSEYDNTLPYRKGTPEYKDWDSDLEIYRKKADTYKDRDNDVA